jgi:hypothetical protein
MSVVPFLVSSIEDPKRKALEKLKLAISAERRCIAAHSVDSLASSGMDEWRDTKPKYETARQRSLRKNRCLRLSEVGAA